LHDAALRLKIPFKHIVRLVKLLMVGDFATSPILGAGSSKRTEFYQAKLGPA
jgi:hypothetical protein